jgi:hypothetical protein
VAEVVAEGKALLAQDVVRAADAEKWQKEALNILHLMGAQGYNAREARFGGFLEWAGSTFFERTRRDNIRLTISALEESILHPESAVGAAPPAPIPAAAAPGPVEYVFNDVARTRLTEEAERMRLVEEVAHTLSVALPQTIEWSENGASYDGNTDTLLLPADASRYSNDEYKALIGHELQHVVQSDEQPELTMHYDRARDSLRYLARELVTHDDSLPMHLRATTILAGVSAYATFVLLGKTIGYERELDADTASARVASPQAAIGLLEKASDDRRAWDAEQRAHEQYRVRTWFERVISPITDRVADALESEHPSIEARIERLRKQEKGRDENSSRTR